MRWCYDKFDGQKDKRQKTRQTNRDKVGWKRKTADDETQRQAERERERDNH